jgi:hypothetical protein
MGYYCDDNDCGVWGLVDRNFAGSSDWVDYMCDWDCCSFLDCYSDLWGAGIRCVGA